MRNKILLIALLFLSICMPAQASLIYLNDFSNGNIDANYSLGDGTATFARTGGNGTYIDKYGTMQLEASADTGRLTYGFYNETGYHAYSEGQGLTIEGAATNYLTYSKDFSHGDWTNSNITVDADSATSPDSTANADTLTAGAGNATILQAETWVSVANTGSIFLKRKTGTGNIDITTDGGSTWTTVTLTTGWTRQFKTQTLADPSFGIRIVTSGDAVYAWGAQLEKNLYATSFIPTTTTAVTRNAETCKYATLLNRSAGVESCIVKCSPFFATNGVPIQAFITGTDTKDRRFYFDSDNDALIYPNSTDSSSCAIGDLINDTWTANSLITLGYNIQHSSPYIAGFYQGVADGTNETTDDFTTNAWGTSWWLGSKNTGTLQFNGVIHSIAFFDEVLTDAQHLAYYNGNVTVLELSGIEMSGLAA